MSPKPKPALNPNLGQSPENYIHPDPINLPPNLTGGAGRNRSPLNLTHYLPYHKHIPGKYELRIET